eukprot:TRINITY_DN12054_c0_g1_i1.p1 TRINITY_DN12054_c0_g1~~TRINITY_DN12054_c0_g1_i1.p1  ORF type:complete len:670 (+),score=119.09 TRINITY_DN12054_c0_g1_i1:109-2118(+)
MVSFDGGCNNGDSGVARRLRWVVPPSEDPAVPAAELASVRRDLEDPQRHGACHLRKAPIRAPWDEDPAKWRRQKDRGFLIDTASMPTVLKTIVVACVVALVCLLAWEASLSRTAHTVSLGGATFSGDFPSSHVLPLGRGGGEDVATAAGIMDSRDRAAPAVRAPEGQPSGEVGGDVPPRPVEQSSKSDQDADSAFLYGRLDPSIVGVGGGGVVGAAAIAAAAAEIGATATEWASRAQLPAYEGDIDTGSRRMAKMTKDAVGPQPDEQQDTKTGGELPMVGPPGALHGEVPTKGTGIGMVEAFVGNKVDISDTAFLASTRPPAVIGDVRSVGVGVVGEVHAESAREIRSSSSVASLSERTTGDGDNANDAGARVLATAAADVGVIHAVESAALTDGPPHADSAHNLTAVAALGASISVGARAVGDVSAAITDHPPATGPQQLDKAATSPTVAVGSVATTLLSSGPFGTALPSSADSPLSSKMPLTQLEFFPPPSPPPALRPAPELPRSFGMSSLFDGAQEIPSLVSPASADTVAPKLPVGGAPELASAVGATQNHSEASRSNGDLPPKGGNVGVAHPESAMFSSTATLANASSVVGDTGLQAKPDQGLQQSEDSHAGTAVDSLKPGSTLSVPRPPLLVLKHLVEMTPSPPPSEFLVVVAKDAAIGSNTSA